MKTVYAWHVHHDNLVEPLTEPIKNRIAYIKANKPRVEIETRLRLLKVVRGGLPAPTVQAGAAYDKARAAYDKAGAAYDKAWAAFDQAGAAYDKAWVTYGRARVAYDKAQVAYEQVLHDNQEAIKALHRKECPDCPWDGSTIFPRAVPA